MCYISDAKFFDIRTFVIHFFHRLTNSTNQGIYFWGRVFALDPFLPFSFPLPVFPSFVPSIPLPFHSP